MEAVQWRSRWRINLLQQLESGRSRRFPFISPVEATWQEANGKIFREAGQATEVNAQGGLLEMKTYPAAGTSD